MIYVMKQKLFSGGDDFVVKDETGQHRFFIDGKAFSSGNQLSLQDMGAKAVLCGRAYAYGLAAAGEAGVARALEILHTDLERTLRLLGCPSVAALDRSYVNVPKTWEGS